MGAIGAATFLLANEVWMLQCLQVVIFHQFSHHFPKAAFVKVSITRLQPNKVSLDYVHADEPQQCM